MDNKTIKALLVEQDPSACEFVKQAFSDCSKTVKFDTKTAKNLSRAIELLNRNSFDIILSDLQLPDSGGIDTVRRIRASNPHIPIVVMTELADEEVGLQAIKNGADDYLVKGKIFRDVLARSIRYAIERRKERTRTEKVLKDERNRAQNYLEEVKNINKELEDFAHVVSHDLKAPLRRIRTLAEWLATGCADKLDRQGKEQINLLLKRVDRMRDLIDGVLQYSRATRGHGEGTQVNLNEGLSVVKKIVESYGGKIWVQSKPGKESIFFFTLPKQQMVAKDAKLQDGVALPEMTAWAS